MFNYQHTILTNLGADVIYADRRAGTSHLASCDELHRVSADSERQPAADSKARNTPAVRVLLADDHRIMRQGLMMLLEEEADIEVVGEAADGKQAVEMTRRYEPDVVIMDITMPILNGIEATRQITAEMPQVRVIGLSMHESADMDHAMREAGAVAYLAKGGQLDSLTAAIRQAARAPRNSDNMGDSQG